MYRSEAPSARLRTARMFSRVDTKMLASHMHDGHDGRHDLYMWSTRPAKTCVRRIIGISQSGRRRSGLARLASARCSISRCLCRLTYAGINVYIFGGSTPPRVHVETSQPAKTPAYTKHVKPSSRRWDACHRRRRIHSHSFPAFPIPLFPGSPFVPVDCFVIGVLARVSSASASS